MNDRITDDIIADVRLTETGGRPSTDVRLYARVQPGKDGPRDGLLLTVHVQHPKLAEREPVLRMPVFRALTLERAERIGKLAICTFAEAAGIPDPFDGRALVERELAALSDPDPDRRHEACVALAAYLGWPSVHAAIGDVAITDDNALVRTFAVLLVRQATGWRR